MKIPLLTILFFLCASATYSQSNISSRTKYNLPANEEGIVSKQLFLQDSSVIFILKVRNGTTQSEKEGTYSIIKTNKFNWAVWAKNIKNTAYNVSIKDAVLLQDGSVLLTGTFDNKVPGTDYSEKFFLMKLDPTGQVVWQQFFQLNKSVNNIQEINYPLLKETIEGNLFVSFVPRITTPLTTRPQNYPAVAMFTNNGNLLWSRYFFNSNTNWANCWSRAAIDLSSNIIANFDVQYHEQGYSSGESYSLSLKINKLTGNLLATKKFLFTGLDQTKGAIYNNGASAIINNTVKNIIDFNSYDETAGYVANDLQAISFETDTSLNLLNKKEIHYKGLRQKNILPDNTSSYSKQFFYNNTGELLIGFKDFYFNTWVDTLRYYFVKLSANYSPLWQKKFFIYSPKNVNHEAPSIIETDNCNTQIALTHITKYNSFNTERSFEVINFNPQIKYNNPCFGEDTSFIEVKDAAVEQSAFFWQQQFSNVLLPWSTTILLEDIPVTKTDLCSFVNDCSNISITGPDSACTGTPFTITTKKMSACHLPVQWNIPFAIADTVHVNDTTLSVMFKQEWQGKLYIYAGDCKISADSLAIKVFTKTPPVSLGKDTMFCNNQPVVLKPAETYRLYEWNNGSKDSVITVYNTGRYIVKATDFCGNVSTDTIEVKPQNFSLFAGRDTSLCKGDTIRLLATPGFVSYEWSPGYGLDNPFSNAVHVFTNKNTTYTVKALKFTGCSLTSSVFVKSDSCLESIFVPNGFTPNNDGLNDLFYPVMEGAVQLYAFTIYNRYGQVVFKSNKLREGWNGHFKTIPQPPGIYTWKVEYRFRKRNTVLKTGTVMLVR